MTTASAIIIGAAIIAGAILFAFRWEVASPGVMRLDRWTGTVVLCNIDDHRPTKADCEPK